MGNPLVHGNASEGMQWPALLSTDFWGRELFPYAVRCNRTRSLASYTLFRLLGDCTPEKDAQASSRHPANRPWSHLSFRPLTVATLRLDFIRSGATRVRAAAPAMHASNLAYYAICASAAFLLFHVLHGLLHRRLRSRAADGQLRRIPLPLSLHEARPLLKPALAALAFATHTVHSEVACNVTTRADALAGALMLAACAVYLAHRGQQGPAVPRWQHAAATLLFALLTGAASFCKEYAVILPALLGVCEAWLAVVDAVGAGAGRDGGERRPGPGSPPRRSPARSPAQLLSRLPLPAALRGPMAHDVAPAARAFAAALRPRLPALALLAAAQVALYILRVRLIIGRCVPEGRWVRSLPVMSPAVTPSLSLPCLPAIAYTSTSSSTRSPSGPAGWSGRWASRTRRPSPPRCSSCRGDSRTPTPPSGPPPRCSTPASSSCPSSPRHSSPPSRGLPRSSPARQLRPGAQAHRRPHLPLRRCASPSSSPSPPRSSSSPTSQPPTCIACHTPPHRRPLSLTRPCLAAPPHRGLHGGRAHHAAPLRCLHAGHHRGGLGACGVTCPPHPSSPLLTHTHRPLPASRAHRCQGVCVDCACSSLCRPPARPLGVLATSVPQGCACEGGPPHCARLGQSGMRGGAPPPPRRLLRRALPAAGPRLGQRGAAGAL